MKDLFGWLLRLLLIVVVSASVLAAGYTLFNILPALVIVHMLKG